MVFVKNNCEIKLHNPISLSKTILERNSKRGAFFIHYACENLYLPKGGASASITSISLYNFYTGEIKTFSAAEALDRLKISKKQSLRRYKLVEKTFLNDFFSFLYSHKDAIFVHWGMNSSTYGFQALYDKFKSYEGTPSEIPLENIHDFSAIMNYSYGKDYCDNPKLINLIKTNGLDRKELLDGSSEAACFEEMEFAKARASNIHKTKALAKMFISLSECRIKVKRGELRNFDNKIVSFFKRFWKLILGLATIPLVIVGQGSNFFGFIQGLCDFASICTLGAIRK